ncbi:U7 snRNA-associated Sm-like protein LSm10 [Elysia marginata]|uniref:U7 snRNA-associated Sm-like protein LSm10 n=1 Tax=Elysia marginata TaxID=1093978 RepID=A0AAV4EH42_9GAST|nr:U7 snRNA-associated Sm-like protein LSm10 [Elysia marginata]
MENSGRSKFFYFNTMVCLLKAIEGTRVRVEIRNGVKIEGLLVVADASMSLEMTDVTLTPIKGAPVKYGRFYVRGRQIRYVVIPDEVDMLQAMDWQINKFKYQKSKEMRQQKDIFERRQKIRERNAAKLEKKERKLLS